MTQKITITKLKGRVKFVHLIISNFWDPSYFIFPRAFLNCKYYLMIQILKTLYGVIKLLDFLFFFHEQNSKDIRHNQLKALLTNSGAIWRKRYVRFLNTTYDFFTSAKLCTLGFTNIIKYLCLGLKLVLKFAYHFDRVGKHFLFYLSSISFVYCFT